MFNFVADQVIKGRIYPALALWQARPYTSAWREFGQHWPYTTPLRIQEYCQQHAVPINIFSIDQDLPKHTYYPICLGFFDFTIDYFALLPQQVRQRVIQRHIRILFMYHEGDNPTDIKMRLDDLARSNGLPPSCYVFVSANTAAERLPNFVSFHDFELWYFQRNITAPPCELVDHRTKDFTVLSRVHKSWRAAVMADLWRDGLLENSYWSYCSKGDLESDCPIQIDDIKQLRFYVGKFLENAPFYCDDLSDQQRNDHSITVTEHFSDAYCNLVLESQFDVDRSQGVFLTEKTFKPIKHGQLFFIIGAAGSLQALRNLGYRTFDGILDNAYDAESDHTERWCLLREAIARAKPNLAHLYQLAQEDIRHNQRLFLSDKSQQLNILSEKINECTS